MSDSKKIFAEMKKCLSEIEHINEIEGVCLTKKEACVRRRAVVNRLIKLNTLWGLEISDNEPCIPGMEDCYEETAKV